MLDDGEVLVLEDRRAIGTVDSRRGTEHKGSRRRWVGEGSGVEDLASQRIARVGERTMVDEVRPDVIAQAGERSADDRLGAVE